MAAEKSSTTPQSQFASPTNHPMEMSSLGRRFLPQKPAPISAPSAPSNSGTTTQPMAKWLSLIVIHGHLILWSILGVLARLGMIGLTEYPNAPVSFGVLWANVAGSFIMGFLLEERVLFVETVQRKICDTGVLPRRAVSAVQIERREEETAGREITGPESEVKPESVPRSGGLVSCKDRASPGEIREEGDGAGDMNTEDTNLELMQSLGESEGRGGSLPRDSAQTVQLADFVKAKKTIPLYIGLATGFCGSFTSFSTFVLDAFLAAVNQLPTDSSTRAGGDSFMAFAAVALLNPGMSLAGFHCGTHMARALGHLRVGLGGIPDSLLPALDKVAAVLGYGCWIGAAFMTAFPPHDHWRGKPLFSLVIGPLGTILRFHLSAFNAGRKYPFGTLTANLLGTALLGAFFDVIHMPTHSVIGCQILEGFSDGFCGCLTTVSTWVAELAALSTKRAYVYGMASFAGGFMILIPVMGGLYWAEGFGTAVC